MEPQLEREDEKSPETTRGLIQVEPHQVEEQQQEQDLEFGQAVTVGQNLQPQAIVAHVETIGRSAMMQEKNQEADTFSVRSSEMVSDDNSSDEK